VTFDANRVRIELCDGMGFNPTEGSMSHPQVAEVWLGDGQGGIRRTRKPAARLVADSRAGVLRQLADWIVANEDPSLAILAGATKTAPHGDGEGSDHA
jgi:hypothetical protein